MVQNVVICGPNLNNQKKGQFHVHVEGCADLKRMANREPEYRNGWLLEDADSKQAVVEHIYEDHMREAIRENGSADWREYDDVYMFPCVKLPDDAPLDEDDPVDEEEDDDEYEDDEYESDEDDEEDTDEEEDEGDPWELALANAKKHGVMDGIAIAEEVLPYENIAGYVGENLSGELYEEASSDDLDQVAQLYVTSLIDGFTKACKRQLGLFLEQENQPAFED